MHSGAAVWRRRLTLVNPKLEEVNSRPNFTNCIGAEFAFSIFYGTNFESSKFKLNFTASAKPGSRLKSLVRLNRASKQALSTIVSSTKRRIYSRKIRKVVSHGSGKSTIKFERLRTDRTLSLFFHLSISFFVRVHSFLMPIKQIKIK